MDSIIIWILHNQTQTIIIIVKMPRSIDVVCGGGFLATGANNITRSDIFYNSSTNVVSSCNLLLLHNTYVHLTNLI